MDLAALSARLTDLGWPIPVAALSRLENGNRRVDVDDLMAISNALQVSPSDMLIPSEDEHPLGTTIPADLSLGEARAWVRAEIKDFSSHERNSYWWNRRHAAITAYDRWANDAERWAKIHEEKPNDPGALRMATTFKNLIDDAKREMELSGEMIKKYPQERPHEVGPPSFERSEIFGFTAGPRDD